MKAFPSINIISWGQDKPFELSWHESLIPTIMPPIKVTTRPSQTYQGKGSLSRNGESIATHKGDVVTNTTELATVVYWIEVIQVAKWNASNIPEHIARSAILR